VDGIDLVDQVDVGALRNARDRGERDKAGRGSGWGVRTGDASRAYQVSETASSLTEIWCGSKGKSDPRQITPKGSGRQLYPRKGSGERRAQRNWPRSSVAVTRGNGNAGSENAGRPYREADMRRDARDEGATQPEVLQLSNASRRSDGYAWKATGNTPGDPPDAPQGEGGP